MSLSAGMSCQRTPADLPRLDNRGLLADGFPKTRERVKRLGRAVRTVDLSESRKLDGGLSCLSLRF